MRSNCKILFLVTEDWYFFTHRLSLACAAKEAGFDVVVLTNVNRHGERIRENGLRIINLDFRRGRRNPVSLISIVRKIIEIYSVEKPYIVHHVALKPVVLGSLASYFSRVPYVINALTGLGSAFVADSVFRKLLKMVIYEPVLGLIFKRKNTYTIVQNIDDKKRLIALGIIHKERTFLIRGSGVNTNTFIPAPEKDETPVVLFASRMIRDKGVDNFVAAARQLSNEGFHARFVMVGDVDPGNPSSIHKTEITKWQEEGIVEWWGYREDMDEVYRMVHIVCLPSVYGEGLPKVLLEAAASGRPLIATDIPGCREIVRDGENGILVPVKNTAALVEGIKKLAADGLLRRTMGERGRKIVETEFSSEIINNETLGLYKHILESSG